jgi:hypothetical protein
MSEVLYEDGSRSEFRGQGGAFHEGGLAIHRLRLITLKSAIEIELTNPGFRLTKISAHQAILNVLTPLTGKTYKRSVNGKKEALSDCLAMLASIEGNAVVLEGE